MQGLESGALDSVVKERGCIDGLGGHGRITFKGRVGIVVCVVGLVVVATRVDMVSNHGR